MTKSSLVVFRVGLSANAQAKVVESAEGINGKVNEATDGRQYFIVEFKDPENPFSPTRTKVIAQNTRADGTAFWPAITPKQAALMVGKKVPGSIVVANVEEYTIPGATAGEERVSTTYTAVVLGHETAESVFTRAGHTMIKAVEVAAPVAAVPALIEDEKF